MVLTWFCQWVVQYFFRTAGLEEGKDYIVHDARFYREVVLRGSLGLGESYMAGDWSASNLTDFFVKLCSDKQIARVGYWLSWCYPWEWFRTVWYRFFNPQSLSGSRKVGKEHYDLDHRMYEQMLSTPMMYSCAYWKGVETLEEAQTAKMDLLARKLQLRPGQRVLDIGCGWGDMAIFLAQKYQCQVVGLTISEEQLRIAEQRASAAGVSDKVTYLLEDYRLHQGIYDAVVSVGMLEHCGAGNLTTYFQCVRNFLKPGGLAAIHSITGRTNTPTGDAWINRYIFPNSAIPSHAAWFQSLVPVELEVEDVQNLSVDYARTLVAWRENYGKYCAERQTTTFNRMWNYYLTASETQFRIRGLNLFQLVLSRERLERYDAPR